jgi:hypothetical protein
MLGEVMSNEKVTMENYNIAIHGYRGHDVKRYNYYNGHIVEEQFGSYVKTADGLYIEDGNCFTAKWNPYMTESRVKEKKCDQEEELKYDDGYDTIGTMGIYHMDSEDVYTREDGIPHAQNTLHVGQEYSIIDDDCDRWTRYMFIDWYRDFIEGKFTVSRMCEQSKRSKDVVENKKQFDEINLVFSNDISSIILSYLFVEYQSKFIKAITDREFLSHEARKVLLDYDKISWVGETYTGYVSDINYHISGININMEEVYRTDRNSTNAGCYYSRICELFIVHEDKDTKELLISYRSKYDQHQYVHNYPKFSEVTIPIKDVTDIHVFKIQGYCSCGYIHTLC